jgi:hypothetical protein
VSHRNARLAVHGRRLLVKRVVAGRPVAHVAAEVGHLAPPHTNGSAGGGRRASQACATVPVGPTPLSTGHLT